MAIDINLDLERQWLFARAVGSLSIEDTTTFIDTVRSQIQRRMWPLVFDARSCGSQVVAGEIEQAVENVREYARRGRQRGPVALVADHHQLYQRFLMYQAECSDIDATVIRVFRQLEAARRWLELLDPATRLA